MGFLYIDCALESNVVFALLLMLRLYRGTCGQNTFITGCNLNVFSTIYSVFSVVDFE